MSSSVDISQSQMQQISPCFDIQEFRCRSQGSNDSFDDFLPAIDVMSFCTQLSKQNSEKRRVRFALIPAVFGVDGSSPPHVSSWGYKPLVFPNDKENSSKRRRVDAAKINRRDERRHDESNQRWGYSSPAFHYRSAPHQLYKLKNALNKLEQNPRAHCVVPGMNIQQAILFERSLSTKFLSSNEETRKHNNTPVDRLEAATPQVSLKKNVSMPDLRASLQTCQGGKEGKRRLNQYVLHKTSKTITAKENMEASRPAAKCPLCIEELGQEYKKDFVVQAKKIDIKLPCLDNSQEI